MKRLTVFLLLNTLIIGLSAQINKYGVPFIRNYPTQITQGAEQNWCIAKDKFGNIYFGNQDRGVIRFDGTKWSAIPIRNNSRVYSLASDERGIVYVGASYEFGFLQPDEKGNTEYVSLTDRVDSAALIKIIYSIELQDENVIFLGPKFIYIYNRFSESLTEVDLKKYNLLDAYKLARINDKLIITDNRNGLFELQDTIVRPLPGGDFFKGKVCTVLLPYNESKVIICTYSDGLFLYDYNSGAVREDFIDRKLNEKFKVVAIYAAAKIADDLFAIGTTTDEGILVFDKSGELISQINEDNSDLEDNTIYALYCDFKSSSELWISTYGVISKAYTNLSLYTQKQGIDNAVNQICEFNGNFYLTTDAGIYKSYVDDNALKFKKFPNTDAQFFPIEVIKSNEGEFLLAGSVEGIIQITSDDKISNVL